jgi:protein TonB
MKLARVALALVLAAAMTFSLLFLMHALIDQDVKPPEDDDGRKLADIHMPEHEIETQYDTAKPDKPEDPEEPPPDLPEPEFDQPDIDPDAMNMSAPRVAPNLSVKSIGGFGSDGEYLPIVKVQPTYPRRALQRGIEGYVIVEFTVTTNGSVRDAYVIDSEPPKTFDNAAIKAALKFKYKPRVIDGEAVEVSGVQNKITFAIAK